MGKKRMKTKAETLQHVAPVKIHKRARRLGICSGYGCQNILSKRHLQNDQHYCAKCEERVILGIRTRSDYLLRLKKYCVAHDYKGKHIWHLKCKKKGCQSTYTYNAGQKDVRMTCLPHRQFFDAERPFSVPYARLRHTVARFQRACDIDYPWFAGFCEKNKSCFYCGHNVGRTKFNTEKQCLTKSPFLDRIDPSKGYLRKNVVTCCLLCNMTKMDLISPQEQMVISAMRNGDQKSAIKWATTLSPPSRWPSSFWGQDYQGASAKLRAKLKARAEDMKKAGLKRNGLVARRH